MYQFAILIIVVGGVLGMIYMIVAMMSYPNKMEEQYKNGHKKDNDLKYFPQRGS